MGWYAELFAGRMVRNVTALYLAVGILEPDFDFMVGMAIG